MTKRCGIYQTINVKRPKLDEDELWDDDLDADALDKCFELATQVCADDVANLQASDVSILPSYSSFKNPSVFACSTQSNNNPTSKLQSFKEFESEIRRLKQQNEEKEGEISILRAKIKEASSTVQTEQQKTTDTWREKLQLTQRQVKSIQTDLDFKNLEIANLKQQLRKASLDVTTSHSTQHFVAPQPIVKVNHERVLETKKDKIALKKEPILDPIYPLKSISLDIFAQSTTESHTINTTSYKITRNTIPYLQNQLTSEETDFNHKCPRVGAKKVYSDIVKLVNSNWEELNSYESLESINRVIGVCLVLLKDLSDYLVELGCHLRTEDVQQADVNYLLNQVQSNSSVRAYNVQLGVQAGQMLDVVSALVSCNAYTANYICQNSCLKISEATANLIPPGAVTNDYYLLHLLLTIATNIGKYRLARQTNSFLISTVNLLETIASLNNVDYISEELFCKLFKAIVFAQPGYDVVSKITFLLKVGAKYDCFVKYLFSKNDHSELLKAGPKGILYFSEGVCTFCVLAILLQNYALQTPKMPLEILYNMLTFIYNTFKTSHWIHHENGEKVCACLSQLYKLETDFVFRGISEFIKCYYCAAAGGLSEEWLRFINHNVIQKVLNQMNFNNYELTEKYVMVFAQFKEIERALKSEGLFNVTQLNISEELIKIAPTTVNKDF